jgi:hypothetical protein
MQAADMTSLHPAVRLASALALSGHRRKMTFHPGAHDDADT